MEYVSSPKSNYKLVFKKKTSTCGCLSERLNHVSVNKCRRQAICTHSLDNAKRVHMRLAL